MSFKSEIFILVQKIKCMPKRDLELPSQCNAEPNDTISSTKYINGTYASNICHAILPY